MSTIPPNRVDPQDRSNPRILAALLALILAASILAVPLAMGGPHAAEPTQGWPSPAGWPEYGGNHHRDAYAPVIGPATSGHAPNTPGSSGTELPARSFSSPVIDHEGHIFVGDISGRVTKLTPRLEVVWTSQPLGAEIRSSVLAAPDGNIYVAPPANQEEHGSTTGDLVALEKATGEELWRIDIGNTAPERGNYIVTAAPAYHPDGFLLQGSLDGHMYAISLDGEQLWRFATDPQVGENNRIVSTPAISKDGTIYFGAQNGVLYALAPDGSEKWSFAARAQSQSSTEMIVASPSIGTDESIYIGTRVPRGSVGVIYAVGPDGQERWNTLVDEKVVAPVTVRDDGALFVGALDGSFYRLAPTDGNIQWIFNPHDDDPTLDSRVSGIVGGVPESQYLFTVAEQATVDTAGRVYVTYWNVRLDGEFPPQNSRPSPVYALDAETGEIEWRNIYDRTQRAPVIMPITQQNDDGTPHGVMYLSGDDARIRAVGGYTPNPVVLPAPGLAEDPPEAPEDDVTIQPEPTNETTDPNDQSSNETGAQDNTQTEQGPGEDADTTEGEQDPQGPVPLFEELPAPGAALLVLVLLGALPLARRLRRT
jgi:outer membrane protein assembly factor BamB